MPASARRRTTSAAAPDGVAALERYRARRDFSRTPEPAPGAAGGGAALAFVIQRHAARRLHFDFRLEWDGVLKSWAVPKGPSLDPEARRLAVQTEDHPLAYGSFEGTIPAGAYGAGEVLLWDRGEWQPLHDAADGLRRGKLHFALRGAKLAGEFVLVRTGREGNQWLLRKLADRFARPGDDAGILVARPESVAPGARPPAPEKTVRTSRARSRALPAPPALLLPQLATTAARPPRAAGWVYEVKYDGYRMLARLENGAVKIVSRNGQDWTRRLAPLAAELAALPAAGAWLDGEITVPLADGRSSFQALQNALDRAPARIVFHAFDLLWLDGADLRPQPQAQRYARLQVLLGERPAAARVQLSGQLEADGATAWEAACRMQLEGLIGKRLDAPYAAGRVRHWIKLKCRPAQEFVIGGWTAPGGSRTGLGALLLGVQAPQGGLAYAGRVGTGFDTATLARLRARLDPLTIERSPFSGAPAPPRAAHWVRPQLVAQVEFAEWTDEGLLRQASFVGLREDKDPRSVVRERPAAETEPAAAPAAGAIRITHPERMVYPDAGLTKREVVRYYEAIGALMLPELAGRPLSMVRCPDGIGAPCFFQKHLRTRLPAGVQPVTVQERSGPDEYVAVSAAEGIAAMAQHGVLEFHPWGARRPRIDRPDRLIMDLDPDDAVAWPQVLEAALLTRTLLQELGLAAFLKTTGGKGLHVVAPLAPTRDWDTVKAFARALAQRLAQVAPQRFTAQLAKEKRRGRIFIDYLRNGAGATAIAAWSLRARPGAPVAMPLAWDELRPKRDLRFDAFNLRNALAAAEAGRAAWAGMATAARAIPAQALRTLAVAPAAKARQR